jgi:hypothetical protein
MKLAVGFAKPNRLTGHWRINQPDKRNKLQLYATNIDGSRMQPHAHNQPEIKLQ